MAAAFELALALAPEVIDRVAPRKGGLLRMVGAVAKVAAIAVILL